MSDLIEVNKYVSNMFPGAAKLFFDKQEQTTRDETTDEQQAPPPVLLNDISQVKSEIIDLSCDT